MNDYANNVEDLEAYTEIIENGMLSKIVSMKLTEADFHVLFAAPMTCL